MQHRKRSLTRRQWIGAAAAMGIAGIGLDAFAIEPSYLTVTRHDLGAGAGSGSGDGAIRPIRIVQLSDLHLEQVGRIEERIAEAVDDLKPDLVLLTGDIIDQTEHVGLIPRFLSLLDPQTRKLAILGNWEYWTGIDLRQLKQTYARYNCQLLRNESVTIAFGTQSLLVTGLDDYVGGKPDFISAIRGAMWEPNHLVLAHCPLQRDKLPPALNALPDTFSNQRSHLVDNIDPRLFHPQYMVSGHTHGGQIAPFGYAPLCPPGSGRYIQGWYRDGDTVPALYVSRGIGTSFIPARLGAPPEIAYFEWSLARNNL